MTYKDILRYQPWLRFININNISDRFLKYTKGDMFVAYNTKTGCYELHSIKSFKLTNYSHNVTIEKELLNGWLYQDFRATELKKFMLDIESDRILKKHNYDVYEKTRPARLKNQLKMIERIAGTKL